MNYSQGVSKPRPLVSVVSPFFNEAAIIGTAVGRMVANLREQLESWELVLVNDGSTDDSLERLQEALVELAEPRVRVVSYPVNHGRGRALKTGIEHARGELVVTTEADCSWGDRIVAQMVEALLADETSDFVVASPHAEGGGLVGVPASRVLLTSLGNKLISFFFQSGLTMHTGMTRCYRRDIIAPLRTIENGKEFHLEVLLKLILLGFRCREVPATLSWEIRNQAKGEPRPTINANILRLIVSHLGFLVIAQPVRNATWAAAISFLGSIAFLIPGLINLALGEVSVFFAILSLVMLLFSLIFIGFASIFSQFRDRAIESWVRDYPEWPPMRTAPQELSPGATQDQA